MAALHETPGEDTHFCKILSVSLHQKTKALTQIPMKRSSSIMGFRFEMFVLWLEHFQFQDKQLLSVSVEAWVQVRNVRHVWTRDLRCVFTPQAASPAYSALSYLHILRPLACHPPLHRRYLYLSLHYRVCGFGFNAASSCLPASAIISGLCVTPEIVSSAVRGKR